VTQTVIKNNEIFSVDTVIRNAGSVEQSVTVWTCSYPSQWKADNPAVHVNDVACMQNVPSPVKLKAGGTYRRSVSIHVQLADDKTAGKQVIFRLAYTEHAYFLTNKPLLWSNPVTVTVMR
jgi:hypothetical protein